MSPDRPCRHRSLLRCRVLRQPSCRRREYQADTTWLSTEPVLEPHCSTAHCRHHSHRMCHQHTAQSQQPYHRPTHLHNQSSSMLLVPRSSAAPWWQHQMQTQTHMSPSHSEQHESSHRTSHHSSDQSPSIARDLQCTHHHQKRHPQCHRQTQSQHTSSRCSRYPSRPCQHHKMLLCTVLMRHQHQSTSQH